MKGRQYASQILCGSGGKNGIVIAVDTAQGKLRSTRRVASRVLGAEVLCSADTHTRRFACIHGLNEETKAEHLDAEGRPVASCFALQAEEAERWLAAGGGGLLGGDLNRVVCSSWRVGSHRIGGDDRRIQAMARWHCSCCCDSERPAAATRVIGANGANDWTRWATTTDEHGRRRWGNPSARIDYALAFGAEEGRWREGSRHAAEESDERDKVSPLSDHIYWTVRRDVLAKTVNARPRPVQVDKAGNKAVHAAYISITKDDETLADALDAAVCRAATEGRSQEGAIAAELRLRGETAAEQVRRQAAQKREEAAKRKASELPAHRHAQWMSRLQEALRLQEQGASPQSLSGGVLFANATGLRSLRGRGRSDDAVWAAVIRRCRR